MSIPVGNAGAMAGMRVRMADTFGTRASGLNAYKPEEVIASRTGDVLIKHTVLKADHFPSA